MSDLFELSFRWQDGAVQVLIYCAIITGGLYLLSKINIKEREREIMSNYRTVGELIEHLKGEDSNAPIIYQYYLAEHFEVSEEVFGQVAKEFDSIIPCLDNSYLAIEEETDSKREEVNV